MLKAASLYIYIFDFLTNNNNVGIERIETDFRCQKLVKNLSKCQKQGGVG